MAERFYLCIDLKSFFASVEAVDRGLDPFTTNLVVALRCGYECEGVLRKYFVLRGQPRDMKMFAKVAE